MPALVDVAVTGDAACVGEMLAAGVDVDEANEHGDTALIEAGRYDGALVVRLLIEAGADLEKAD